MKKQGDFALLSSLDGTLKKASYGSQTTDYTYNLANMLTEVNNANGSTQISKYSYTYYVDGNQKSKTESVAGSNKGTTNYTYDGLNRLVQEEAPNNTYSYQYDSYGNRSQLSVTGDETYTTNYTYDKNNRMRNQTKTAGTAKEITDFWYDPNGNQISSMTVSTGGTGAAGVGIALVGTDNTSSYSEYNSWNQLTKTMQNGKTASYIYNGDGLRMSKTVDGVTTSHIWDGTNIAGDVTNGTVTKYIRGLQLISSKKGSNESFYTYNGHGDVVQLTDGSGSITKKYSYDAFGVEYNKDSRDTNPFRYCGEYYDTETDSVYLRARYYRPTTGRFITEDPIRDGFNWYLYCMNNPIFFIDPSGNYYIKKNSRGRYILEPDTYWSVFGRLIAVTFSASLVSELEYSAFNIVGENSAVYGDAFEEGSLMQLQEQFPELAILFKVKDVYDGLQMVFERDRIVQTDNIAFGLLSHAGISTSNGNKRTLEKIMDGTYAFIHSNSYFVDGLSAVFDNQTLHRIDYNLSQAKDPQKIIDKYKQKAYSYFISIGYDAGQAQGKANSVESMLNKYDERRQIMFDEYDDFIWNYINN